MAKTNYTKVEQVISQRLNQLEVNKLLDEADVAMGKKPQGAVSRKAIVSLISNAVRHFSKTDKRFYRKLGIRRDEVKELLSKKDFSDEEWKKVLALNNKLKEYRKDLAQVDEDFIEKERIKENERRHNVNEKWLPLR